MKTFIAFGNYGDLTCDANTGEVLTYHAEDDAYGPDDPEGQGYRDVERLDVKEWRDTYPGEELADGRHDLLDFGFWTKGGKYEPADESWREAFRQDREGPPVRIPP
jgi:hypothetical protein